jgi:hypothetical protein
MAPMRPERCEALDRPGSQTIEAIVRILCDKVRAFMTTVTCGLKNFPAPNLYSYLGAALYWAAPALHSQGALAAARCRLIHSELERIASYCRKGDLISYAEAIAYLDQRDEISVYAK